MTADDTRFQDGTDPVDDPVTDPLQPGDDVYDVRDDQEQLNNDGVSPAAPPDDVATPLDDQHPVTDTDVDAQEVYDAGMGSVADLTAEAENEAARRRESEI